MIVTKAVQALFEVIQGTAIIAVTVTQGGNAIYISKDGDMVVSLVVAQ